MNVCVISIWIGKLPSTFELWEKSVATNKNVSFLLVTDQNYESILNNLKVVKMNLSEIKELAIKKLGMNISLERPYKLCDFKPVWGVIFEDHLKGYDYWGHCDMDLMFGDLKSFFEKYDIYQYDKFLVEGHLALYRNTEKCNKYYTHVGSYYPYDMVFTSDSNFAFDEQNKVNFIYKRNKYPLFENVIYANINPAKRRFQCCNLKNYRYQVFYWEDGKVFRAYLKRKKIFTEEFVYIHLLKRKFDRPDENILKSDSYYLTDKGFLPKTEKGVPSVDEIRRISMYPGFWFELKENIKNEYRYRWKKASLKRRFSLFLHKHKLGRKILKAKHKRDF